MSASGDEDVTHDVATPASQGKYHYVLAALVSLIGLADSIYLTVHHLTGESVRCTLVSGCDAVLSSRFATIGGLPVAGFGALAYLTVFSLSTLAAYDNRLARKLLLFVILPMMAMTLWLLYLQAFVIHYFCEFCLLSAAVTTALAVIVAAARRSAR